MAVEAAPPAIGAVGLDPLVGAVLAVETLVPIRNETVHDQVLEQVLLANLLDTEQSWLLDGEDGSYERVEADGPDDEGGFNCHDYFMTNPSLSGRGGALAESRVPKLTLRKGAA